MTDQLYKKEEQIELVEALVDMVLKENIESKNKGEHEDFTPGGSLCAYLHRYAPILKDSSFREEKEWRIISRPLSCKRERYDYRPGKSMLVPYYKIVLTDSNEQFLLKDVVIGPTPHLEQSKWSVSSFLVSQNLRKVSVSITNVPFRDW